jgi:hypothetical protein
MIFSASHYPLQVKLDFWEKYPSLCMIQNVVHEEGQEHFAFSYV